jgi:RNA polymerase sigma-70 factor, ECF subfamily
MVLCYNETNIANKRITIDMVQLIKCDGKSDKELVRLTLENPDYFLCLMKNYEDKIIRYIRRISGVRHEDAEDVCQEVFIKVFKNLNAFDTDLKFSSWVYRIAHNHVISEFRKYKNRKEQIMSEEEDWQHFVSQIDVEKEVGSVVNKEIVNKVLAELDIKYREVLVLNFLEGYEYKEISDILKKPMGTVATLLNRAKKKFKQELDKDNIKLN